MVSVDFDPDEEDEPSDVERPEAEPLSPPDEVDEPPGELSVPEPEPSLEPEPPPELEEPDRLSVL